MQLGISQYWSHPSVAGKYFGSQPFLQFPFRSQNWFPPAQCLQGQQVPSLTYQPSVHLSQINPIPCFSSFILVHLLVVHEQFFSGILNSAPHSKQTMLPLRMSFAQLGHCFGHFTSHFSPANPTSQSRHLESSEHRRQFFIHFLSHLDPNHPSWQTLSQYPVSFWQYPSMQLWHFREHFSP